MFELSWSEALLYFFGTPGFVLVPLFFATSCLCACRVAARGWLLWSIHALWIVPLYCSWFGLAFFSEAVPGGYVGRLLRQGVALLGNPVSEAIVVIGSMTLLLFTLCGVFWVKPFLNGVARAYAYCAPRLKSISVYGMEQCVRMATRLRRDHVALPSTLDIILRDILFEDAHDQNHAFMDEGSVVFSAFTPASMAVSESVDNNTQSVVAEEEQGVVRRSRKKYVAPATTLFEKKRAERPLQQKTELKRKSRLLEEKLALFGVEGTVIAAHQGPVVACFEYEPAADCRVAKILSLEDDLALALQALSVRIRAPIPGTSCVGFEVAFSYRETVYFGECVRSSSYKDSSWNLPLVIGKDIAGEVLVIDLATVPHLLVAGTTGSGKSVGMHTFLAGLLHKKSPDDLRVILIDPKRLEFSAYQGIPHLLMPIITDAQRALQALEWVVREMERRYEMLAQAGVRSCIEYRAQGKELPFIVVMIDELADLMMVAGAALEESIARIAQMARAAGIHLIVATQRPSTDVITGLIKVNFPGRIAFKVSSKIDSRIILDAPGAEKLVGRGDLLFLDQQGVVRRAHGAYIDSGEVAQLVAYWREQGAPEYVELAQQYHASSMQDDPLFNDVVAYVQQQDEVSISSIQRVFRIGYNRSARLIELLESRGFIAASGSGKMRKVLHRP